MPPGRSIRSSSRCSPTGTTRRRRTRRQAGTLWEKFEEYETGTDFKAWACRVAYYKVLEVRAGKQRGPLAFSDAFVDAVDSELTARSPETESRRSGALHTCLDHLSVKDRELIERRYQQGATTRQVADDVGRSRDAIYKALNRIHQSLFECIERTIEKEERQ